MNALIVKFRLDSIDDAKYVAMSEQWAASVAQVPGLIAKAWLRDAEAGQYGGMYLFESRAAISAYLESPLIQSFASSGMVTNLNAEVFDLVEPATTITSGPIAAAAV